MLNIVFPSEVNRKEYLADIADGLIRSFEKKKFYTPFEVDRIHKSSKWNDRLDSCWAICVFSKHEDFDRFYKMKEGYDYLTLRKQMLNKTFKTDGDYGLGDIIWDSVSWVDFGEVFEPIFEGIGEFISGILGEI